MKEKPITKDTVVRVSLKQIQEIVMYCTDVEVSIHTIKTYFKIKKSKLQ